MHLPTLAWTERHTRVGLAFAVAASGSLAGLADARWVAVWVGVAVAGTAIVSLATDAFGGLVVGLASAAGLIAARRLLGPWGPDAFWLSFMQTLALMVTGMASGIAGAALRGRDAAVTTTELPGPAFGSLGLLEADVAMGRLVEEVERAAEHRRPLSLVLLESELSDAALDQDARHAARRAVARIFESRLGDGDVPFAMSPDRLGAILPETTCMAAWDRIGRVLDGLADARFRDHSVADAVLVHVGVAELGTGIRDADALLDAATTALHTNRGSDDVAGQTDR